MGHYLTYIFLVFAYKYPHHYYLILCWLLLVDFIFLTFKRLIRFFNTSTGSEAQISTYIIQVDSSHALLLRSPCMPLHEICMFWVLYELLSLLFLCFGFFVVVFLLFLFGGGCYYCCFVFFNNFAFFFVLSLYAYVTEWSLFWVPEPPAYKGDHSIPVASLPS